MMLRSPLVVTTSLLLGCAHTASPEAPPGVGFAGPTPQASDNVEVQTPNHRIAVSAQPSAEVCRDDPRIRSCRVHMTSSDQLPLDLAAGHGAVALLYAEVMPSDQGQETWRGASMIVHDRELTPTGEVRIPVEGWLRDLSLVETSDGWLVALEVDRAIHLVSLDPAGQEFGERQVIAEGATPRLVADGPRTPLLAWDQGYERGFMAQGIVIGGAAPSRVKLFDETIEANFGGQIAVAPGEFLVARRAGRGVELRRMSARGELRSDHADVGRNTEYPTLVRCDDGPRLVWSDFSERGEIRWARLTEDGALDGAMVRLSGTPDHFNHSPAVCDGVDTLVLLAGYTGSTGRSKSLDLVRVDGRGRIIGEPIIVYAEPARLAYDPTMLRDDDALFIAWATHGEPLRIALKRIDLRATAPSTSGPAIAR